MDPHASKRILIFSTAYHPSIGGAEIAVKEITDRLPEHFFDLITVNLSGHAVAEERIGNVYVYRVGKGMVGKFLFPLYGYLKALKLHREEVYDSAWSIMASYAGIAASFFTMKTKVPLVLSLQEGDEETHLARYVGGIQILYKLLIRPWHRIAFKKAQYITVISTYLRDRARLTKTHAPIEIVPNGVDLEFFGTPALPHEVNEIRRAANAHQSDILLITTSRLVYKNGIDDIIAALPLLPVQVKLVVAGVGPLEEDLKDQAEKVGLSSRVTFVGHIAHEKLPTYLQASDIFVRPSRSEGFGNSFVEAMAVGIPVVAPLVGGITDFLIDRETGVACEPHNPQSIAQAVSLLIENPALKKHVVAEARRMVEERYKWSIIAKKMNEVFLRV